mgnify:CR=1 FL=1|jgi:hypothetical protein
MDIPELQALVYNRWYANAYVRGRRDSSHKSIPQFKLVLRWECKLWINA